MEQSDLTLIMNHWLAESATDSLEALKSEKKKLETQVESLKAIAEQHSYLMWSMQSYQQQAETMQQQYNELVAQKDYEVRLSDVLHKFITLKDCLYSTLQWDYKKPKGSLFPSGLF